MDFKKFLTIFILFALPIISCTHRPQLNETIYPIDRLHREIHSIFENPAYANAFWGVAIQSLDTGEIIYRQNANKGFLPASNMKLFTTAAALALLSPDFVYNTKLFYKGRSDSAGVLDGDLIIRGVGDPTIGGRYHAGVSNENIILKIFRSWAEKLKIAGINRVIGNIIGDDNYFEDLILGKGWAWDDQSESYSAQISALSFNNNCIDIFFTPADTLGGIAKFKLLPDTKYVIVDCEVRTVNEGLATKIHFNRKRGTNNVKISGSIKIKNKNVIDRFSIENPTLFAAHIFRDVLVANGIEVKGSVYDIDDLDFYNYSQSDTNCLAFYKSPPISKIIKIVNKSSQNLYAELLFRTLGAYKKGVGDQVHSVRVVHEFLAAIGINPEHILIADGSGLSRNNLVTPNQVLTLLRHLSRQRYFQEFYDSLPIAGVDGTLKGRMKTTMAENNVRAKTGSLGHVRALSGYVKTKDGENIAFSMLANNYTVPSSMPVNIQDLVCERIANFSRK